MKASPKVVKSRLQFLTWLRDRHPQVYESAVTRADRETSVGLGQATEEKTTESPWWQKALTGVVAAGTTYLSLKNQRDVLKANLQRAEQGLPPIDPGTVVSPPVIRTQVDLPPDVITKVTESAGTNINKVLMVAGGIAVLALVMMNR